MINIDNLPIKYITGSYKYDKLYPTQEDLLWDMINFGKKSFNIEYIDFIENELRDCLLNELETKKFIKIKDNKVTILNTPWNGTHD